jgi:hypothetical protein
MKLPIWKALGQRACRALAAVCAAAAVACGGNPVQPPPPPPPNTAPVIRSVTANRTQVDAGQEVEITAVAEDAQTPAELLTYEWTTEPPGGTLASQGRIVRWRAPTDGPVPSDYVVRVTVRDLTLSATMTTSPIRVNDGIREMRQLAEAFLADFSDSSKSAEFVVRNFSNSCGGKQEELLDIQNNRQTFTILNAIYRVDSVSLNASPFFCSAPGGPSGCARVISPARWVSLNRVTNRIEEARGDSWLTGFYENRQWWLCDSRFFGSPALTLNGRFLR